jgi:hypothetical protein
MQPDEGDNNLKGPKSSVLLPLLNLFPSNFRALQGKQFSSYKPHTIQVWFS